MKMDNVLNAYKVTNSTTNMNVHRLSLEKPMMTIVPNTATSISMVPNSFSNSKAVEKYVNNVIKDIT